MRRSVLPIAILSFALASSGAAMADGCAAPKLLNSLPMEKVPGSDTMTVLATIEGKPVRMLVDIGDITTQISRTAAGRIGLTTREGRRYLDFGGRYSQDVARVEKFTMGSMETGGFFPQIVADPDFAAPATIDGVLGTDMMQRYDIDLDFAHGKMNYFAPEACKGGGVYWAPSTITSVNMVAYAGLVYVPVVLDGHEITALLDTGANRSFLNPELAERLFGLKASGTMTLTDGAASIKADLHGFSTLVFGGLTAKNPQIAIPVDFMTQNTHEFHAEKAARDTFYIHEIMPDMVIGMDVLKHSHLYVSFQNQRVYVSAAGDGPALQAVPAEMSWLTVWRYGYDRHLPFVHL